MNFNISGWAIRNPIPPILLFAFMVLMGLISFGKLPITQLPNVDMPVVSITITEPGAAPSELETQVTKPVEDAVAGVSGLKHITSTVSESVSSTVLEFEFGTDVYRAVNDVKDKVDQVRPNLPGSIQAPVVSRVDVIGSPILTYTLSAPDMTVEELSYFIDTTVAQRLQGLPGVGAVSRVGGVDREIRVDLDPVRLAGLGLTAEAISQQLAQTNTDATGGIADLGAERETIRTLGDAKSLADLAATSISLPGGRLMRLDQLAQVSDGHAELKSFARLGGRAVVAVAIKRASGASDVDVAKQVANAIQTLQSDYPGLKVELVDTSVTHTEGNYRDSMSSLYEGAILAVLVVFLFLRDWRATIIAGIALPLSIIPAFAIIYIMGFSLNSISLLAVTLVTGILVDDAIVEIENIVRHIRQGRSAWDAAMEATQEIGLAVIAISLTIIAVFVPVSFMGGISGQFFKQFGLTVAAAVFASLLVARLITPILAAYFLRSRPAEPEREGWLLSTYGHLVRITLRHRLLTILAAFLMFGAALFAIGKLPTGFIPTEDEARSVVNLELPPGTELAETQRVADKVAAVIAQQPEIVSVFISGGVQQAGDIRKAVLTANMTPKSRRSRSQAEIEQAFMRDLASVPDARITLTSGFGGRAVSYNLTGDDDAALQKAANAIIAGMKGLPVIANPTSSAALVSPELRVTPLPVAADLGVTAKAIANTIRVATQGDVEAALPKLNAGDRLVPILVALPISARSDLATLSNLQVQTASGKAVPLSAVASFSYGNGPVAITRYDRRRQIAIEADLAGKAALGQATAGIMSLDAVKNLPSGLQLVPGGDAEDMTEVFSGFAFAMTIGLLLVYAVLVLLFSSFLQPFTILLSLPLAIIGVVAALFLTDDAVSMPVVIGILMLMGIVTKNAIMLVDFVILARGQGLARHEAIVDAGRKRARPIVMTTIAMVAGMLPSAFALGTGGEFRSPMAVAVIGGLIVSTLLSLIIVPSVYSVMDDLAVRVRGALGNLTAQARTPPPGPTDEALS
nr:efflux RND transporter permease subunit [uncultured Hyphomonas sp.]